ncbi:MAG: oligosaccharide flippase family protein [Anaerolineaceae bacterium]|nr:oligosaccharide flippase family protein [Anaerolineaceae bacterium]
MILRLRSLLRSPDTRDGVIMTAATVLAGGFDYLVLVVAGVLLSDPAAIAFLAVMNLLKIAEQVTWVIRNVVAYYTAELAVQAEAQTRIGQFVRGRWRWAWRWGLLVALLFGLAAPLTNRLINANSTAAVVAAGLALLFFFVRPVTDGTLQGTQNFLGLGSVVVLQAVLRFGLTAVLIWAGLELVGAVLALPLASGLALLLALWLLRHYLREQPVLESPKISFSYSAITLVGLLAFAVLVYSDAILVNRLFAETAAAQYTPVNVLARINLFVPVALGMVLFPKATQRQALGQDARPMLLLALAATLLPGLILTALFFLFPGWIVALVFRGQYANPGLLLGWIGLATTLFAGVNIWLNYALSLGRRPFVFVLAIIAVAQITAVLLLHHTLLTIAWVLLASGLTANLAGALLLLRPTQANRS